MNQLIVGAIVIAAALFVMSVIRMPESGGDTAGDLVSVLEVHQDISSESADSPSEASDESIDNPSEASGESADSSSGASGESAESSLEASGESADSPSEASSEGVDSPSEASDESTGNFAETLLEGTPDPETILEEAQSASWAEDVPQLTYSFRNERLLNQHYEKHGIEMGFATIEEYVAAANAVINHPDVLHKQEAEDNDDVYFLEATNEFVVVSTDGFIRTYFIASGGIDYYNRQ